MTSNVDVDLFEDLPAASTDVPVGSNPDGQPTEVAESADGQSTGDSDTDESPVETVAQVPDGAMSITEFAAFMTKTLMREKFEAGEDLDMSEYVVPQSVYQTVKAQRDRIPHVLVKGEDDTEARVYILTEPATTWWKARKERLATRGSGAQRASSRTPEDNLNLLATAVAKHLYSVDRQALWVERVAQSEKLIVKYKGFLSDAKVAEETVALAIQEATDQYNKDKADKDAEKASKKTSGKDKVTDED